MRWGIKLRTSLMLVLAFAMGLWADRAYNRWLYCMERARDYEAKEAWCFEGMEIQRTSLTNLDREIKAETQGPNPEASRVNALKDIARAVRRDIVRLRADAVRFRKQRDRYRLASWMPWLAVPREPK